MMHGDADTGQARAADRVVGRLQQQRSSEDAGSSDAGSATLRSLGLPAGTALDGHRRQPRPTEQAPTRPTGGSLGAAQHRSRVHPKTARHYRRTDTAQYLTQMCMHQQRVGSKMSAYLPSVLTRNLVPDLGNE